MILTLIINFEDNFMMNAALLSVEFPNLNPSISSLNDKSWNGGDIC